MRARDLILLSPSFAPRRGLRGATWAVDGGGRAYNTPTLGSELLTNGGLESWTTSTNLASWTESISGTSTVNQETVDIHGGSNALRIDVDAGNSLAYIQQNGVAVTNNWYQLIAWVKGSAGGLAATLGTTNFPWAASYIQAITTSYAQYIVTGRATGTGILLARSSAASQSVYIDDLTLKQLTASTLMATKRGAQNQTPLAKINALLEGTQAGVIGWLDDPSNPQNFITAIRNHAGTVALLKCVAGVYTSLVSSTVAFVSDAAIEIRRPSGNTFRLYYNGVQVGADQTVNDTVIADNTAPHYGLCSTYSGNTFTEFSLGGSVIPFNF